MVVAEHEYRQHLKQLVELPNAIGVLGAETHNYLQRVHNGDLPLTKNAKKLIKAETIRLEIAG